MGPETITDDVIVPFFSRSFDPFQLIMCKSFGEDVKVSCNFSGHSESISARKSICFTIEGANECETAETMTSAVVFTTGAVPGDGLLRGSAHHGHGRLSFCSLLNIPAVGQ